MPLEIERTTYISVYRRDELPGLVKFEPGIDEQFNFFHGSINSAQLSFRKNNNEYYTYVCMYTRHKIAW